MAESNPKNGFFRMSGKTAAIPMELFALNRRRLAKSLNANPNVLPGSLVLLQGGGDQARPSLGSSYERGEGLGWKEVSI